MIIFLFFIPFLIHSAEDLNKFLIGSRIDSELTQSNILYNRPSQNNASVKTPNGFAVQKILNREASIFFNTNDQIESFWDQYTGQKLRGISHDLSQKMKETNELINSKNYANFNNKYNKELIKIFQDISNTKNINPQKNTAFQSSLETLNSKVRQELLLERKSTVRQCSFRITTNQQKIDNEVTCTRYDNLGDHKYRSNKE